MQAPRVNPVGIVEHPPGYAASARPFSLAFRAVAAIVLLGFTSVGIATTVLSLASYCITSEAGAPAPFPHR